MKIFDRNDTVLSVEQQQTINRGCVNLGYYGDVEVSIYNDTVHAFTNDDYEDYSSYLFSVDSDGEIFDDGITFSGTMGL